VPWSRLAQRAQDRQPEPLRITLVAPDRHPGGAFGPLQDALKPGFHGVRTSWIRGFMTFPRALSR
jgi:hypothetical protein